jgi:hypothetical protein
MNKPLLAPLLTLLALVLAGSAAHANPRPDASSREDATFGKRVLENVVDATNGFFEHNIDRLSHDMVVIRVDAEHQRAKLAVGAGLAGINLHIASNVTVVDGTARVSPRVALAVAGKSVDLKLPTVDVAATEYHGERGVELRLPLLRRTF